MKEDILAPVPPAQARMKNPLVLAYVGDTVFDLYVRTRAAKGSDEHVGALNRQVCALVNARSQARLADELCPCFTGEEAEIYHRGRNAKVGSVPRNMEVIDYHKATGLEAVVGYLFLTGAKARLEELFGMVFAGQEGE